MAQQVELPTHAYIPGITDRHADGAFDHIRDTVQDGMTLCQLSSSDAFRIGLRFLETGNYWEAHEVLEPVWMVLPEQSDARHLVQALIQLANAHLKVKMHKPKAARRLCGITRGLLSDVSENVVMGLDIATIGRRVDSVEQLLKDDL